MSTKYSLISKTKKAQFLGLSAAIEAGASQMEETIRAHIEKSGRLTPEAETAGKDALRAAGLSKATRLGVNLDYTTGGLIGQTSALGFQWASVLAPKDAYRRLKNKLDADPDLTIEDEYGHEMGLDGFLQACKIDIKLDDPDEISTIPIKKGNILLSGADCILHQVNCKGFMENGVSRRIRDRWTPVYPEYRALCQRYVTGNHKELLGTAQFVRINSRQTVVNIFAQNDYGPNRQQTDYPALLSALKAIRKALGPGATASIAIPYGMGCDRDSGGNWSSVLHILNDAFRDYDGEVTIYKD